MDLATIVKAISIAGENTPGVIKLYEGFIAVLKGDDQDDLKERYAAARQHSDALHQRMQSDFGGEGLDHHPV